MEFAFVAPVLLVLGLAGADTTRFVIASDQISKAASTIAQMYSQNGSGSVTYADVQFYNDSMMVTFPDVLADAARKGVPWGRDISITMSSIQFTATKKNCKNNCTYTAGVVWTSGANPRPCGTALAAVPDTAAPAPNTLPTDMFGPGSIIAVDIDYNFTPWFSSFILGSVPIVRSVYLAPRYVPVINYSVVSGDPGTVTVCT